MSPVNRYRQCRFALSADQKSQFPRDSVAEVAFAGRSNAGKSSALNAITDNHSLARTSKTPGRTQLVNFFTVCDDRYLVDLPGYGYAKVPDRVRHHWQEVMEGYLNQRKTLVAIILLVDIRHPLKAFDEMMVEWSRHHEIACHILLTKADKLKRGAAKNSLLQISRELQLGSDAVTIQLFSALNGDGVETARQQLDRLLFNHPSEIAASQLAEKAAPSP
ncbi:MAG: YihA family ribosome biogenesis GTP-binding protein [Gammaproteobacteria bacterium]|nr:YihA family ribosome biogenesis GTP-binding protein [Gammaproteobacteria bacterium]